MLHDVVVDKRNDKLEEVLSICVLLHLRLTIFLIVPGADQDVSENEPHNQIEGYHHLALARGDVLQVPEIRAVIESDEFELEHVRFREKCLLRESEGHEEIEHAREIVIVG